jgi:lysozyme
MTLADSVTEKAYALIAVFEGEKLTAYQDSGEVWTIGMGHTGPDVSRGLRISSEQSLEWFYDDIQPLRKLSYLVPPPILGVVMTMWQIAALLSFGYNCGAGAMNHPENMAEFIHDRHGNVLPGLVARRRLEAALYSNA